MKPMKLNHEYGLITMNKAVVCPTCHTVGTMTTRFWGINPDRQEICRCAGCGQKFVIKHGKGIKKEQRNG